LHAYQEGVAPLRQRSRCHPDVPAHQVNVLSAKKPQNDLDLVLRPKSLGRSSFNLHPAPPGQPLSTSKLVSKKTLCRSTGFNDIGGGNCFSDLEVYKMCRLKGGLAYSEKQLRFMFEDQLEVVEFRPMQEMSAKDNLFGKQFLWTALFKKSRHKRRS